MFILYSTDDDRQLPTEYLPCSAMAPKYGMAMYVTSGKLAKASGANLATYICVREEASSVAAGTIIPVVKIQPDQIWETDSQDASSTIGAAVDVHTDGLSVKTAASNPNGNFVLTAVDGAKVQGRFVK